MPGTLAASDIKIAYWYGEDEKKDRRGNIRFIRRYFPQIQFHVFPQMAHAELVIVHPEEFSRYAEEFLMQEDRIWNGKKSFAAPID